jgi:hypothetical protein
MAGAKVSPEGVRISSYLEDNEFVQFDLALTHIGAYGTEVLVDIFYNCLGSLSRQDLL